MTVMLLLLMCCVYGCSFVFFSFFLFYYFILYIFCCMFICYKESCFLFCWKKEAGKRMESSKCWAVTLYAVFAQCYFLSFSFVSFVHSLIYLVVLMLCVAVTQLLLHILFVQLFSLRYWSKMIEKKCVCCIPRTQTHYVHCILFMDIYSIYIIYLYIFGRKERAPKNLLCLHKYVQTHFMWKRAMPNVWKYTILSIQQIVKKKKKTEKLFANDIWCVRVYCVSGGWVGRFACTMHEFDRFPRFVFARCVCFYAISVFKCFLLCLFRRKNIPIAPSSKWDCLCYVLVSALILLQKSFFFLSSSPVFVFVIVEQNYCNLFRQ